jgi:hypothetical protein
MSGDSGKLGLGRWIHRVSKGLHWRLVLGAFAMVVVSAGAVRADSVTFDLEQLNLNMVTYPGPYATVTINRTSSTAATITFTSLISPDSSNIYLMSDGGTVGVNVNAATFTVGVPTLTNGGTGFTPLYKDNTPGNEDGFGSFNVSLNSKNGFPDASDSVQFTVTDTSGTWNSVSDVLKPNGTGGSGYVAAAHIFITSNPANQNNGAIDTGYAAGDGGSTFSGNDNPPTVPLPSIAWAGLGLMGLVALRRRYGIGRLA